MKQTNCLQCGQEFEAKRSDKKYCSDSCKQKAYKNRKDGDSIGSIEEKTLKVNPAVFPFMKDFLKGLLSDGGGDDYPTDIQAGIQQIKVSKSGIFMVESVSRVDIEALNNSFLDNKGKIINGRTKPINVEKILFWCCDDVPVIQSFTTYKVMIPYDLVRGQFSEYLDDDLIIE
jgi:hypothetical protein